MKGESKWGVLLALPAILGFLIWNLGPIIAAIVIAFTNWNVGQAVRFIGFENFKRLFFDDPIFLKSIVMTFYFAIGSAIASVVTAFIAALLLNQELKFRALFRTIFFLPAIVPAVANAAVWLWIFNPNFGLLNGILSELKLPTLNWIYSEKLVIPSLIIMSAWGMGYTMVIFLAGLQGVPQYLYEALEIDGGNWWHKLRYITLPMTTPIVFFNLVMGLIGSLQTFVQPYLMTQGGPNYDSTFLAYYIYLNAFKYGNFGYASAISVILFAITVGITILIFGTSKYWVYSS